MIIMMIITNTTDPYLPIPAPCPQNIVNGFMVGRKLSGNLVENKCQKLGMCKLFSYLIGNDYTVQHNHTQAPQAQVLSHASLPYCIKPQAWLGASSFTSPSWPLPGGSDGKASTCNAGDQGSIPGLGRSPGEGNGNLLQYSCLENSMDGGAWWSTVHGGHKESDTTE